MGWTKVNTGKRRRRATASVVETRTGSQGRGASLDVASDSDCWGPEDRVADAPPSHFGRGGVFLPPLVDRRGHVNGNDSDGEDKKWTSNMSY